VIHESGNIGKITARCPQTGKRAFALLTATLPFWRCSLICETSKWLLEKPFFNGEGGEHVQCLKI
jgi:hypothetical protein